MKNPRNSTTTNKMRKYNQLILVIVSFVSIVTLLIYRHEYYRLRYVLEVLNFFGKPGLSEIEFCGPRFNATIFSEILRNSSLKVRDSPPLFQQIDDNFYTYSSFLRSFEKHEQLTALYVYQIDTIVVGKVNAKPNFRCNVWFENTLKPKAGRFAHKVMSHVNAVGGNQLYLFHCTMGKDLGKPVAVSFYTNDYNVNPVHAPISRVIEVNSKKKHSENTSIRFVNNIEIAACVLPNQIPLVTQDAIVQFLVYHNMTGINKFTIYDSTISEDVIKRLNIIPTDMTSWDIKFFPLNYPFIFAKSYDIIRGAIELDCMFRHYQIDKEEYRRTSHAVVLSWDEFLVPRNHENLKEVIHDFDPTRKLGKTDVTVLNFCTNQNNDNNVNAGYPEMVKKTHYYKFPNVQTPITVRNLDAISSFDELINMEKMSNRTIPLEVLAVHKYAVCRNISSYDTEGYKESQLQLIPHKFEGAMLKFGRNLVNNKIYRLLLRSNMESVH